MKIRLYADDTVDIRMDVIISNLNALGSSLSTALGKTKFTIPGRVVTCPQTYQRLSPSIDVESKADKIVLLFTDKPYDNNYFWESDNKKVILSFHGWEHLTNLSRNNGAVYFICAILIRWLRLGSSHREKNTGCVNDFWFDKTGVDTGMRCAFICDACIQQFKKHSTPVLSELLMEIQRILDDVSKASRANLDICDFWGLRKQGESFDVFMCHNSDDKDLVREMNARLRTSGVETWLDEEQLPPGRLWQELLEEQISTIRTAAVFVGNSGFGPWQNLEVRAFLQEFIRRRCPVIPVILPECNNIPSLPLFLSQLTWVDFRKTKPDPYKSLLWGITGKKN